MSGTVETVAQLLAGVPTGGPAGGITPTQMQNIVASTSAFAGLDDPNNAIGLGAPAIIRGTIYAHKMTNLVAGAGQTTGVRTSNLTALNAAFADCLTYSKYFQFDVSTYEIYGSTGLLGPAAGSGNYNLDIRGSMSGTSIVQYYAGAPILTLGDVTGGTAHFGLNVNGLGLSYGTPQAASTSSIPLIVGAGYNGSIKNIQVGDFTNFAYRAMALNASTGGIFSMTFDNLFLWGFTQDGLVLNAIGSTGSSWNNIYINNGGSSSPQAMAGSFINHLQPSQDQDFRRVNCEWGSTNCVIAYPAGGQGHRYTALHCEGVTFTGFNPTIFTLTNSIQVDTLNLIDPTVLSANMSGNLFLATTYVGSGTSTNSGTCTINNFNLVLNNASEVNVPIGMYSQISGPLGDGTGLMYVNQATIATQSAAPASEIQGNIFWDEHLAANANLLVAGWGAYEFGPAGSIIRKAILQVAATYTLYGQFVDATIFVPNAITSFTLTLADTMGATGTQPPNYGNTVHIRRMSGTASGTLTVKDGGGTTLSTNTTSAVDLWYVFHATSSTSTTGIWATFTPVT